MPFRKKITEVEASIEATLAEIKNARAKRAERVIQQREGRAELDRMLAALARLKAERLRLMEHQRLALDRLKTKG